MDIFVRSNNDPVNDIAAPVSGLINDLVKVIKTTQHFSLQTRLGNDIGLRNMSRVK